MIGEIAIGVCLGLCMFYALPTLCSLAADVLVAVFPWVMGLIGIALVVIIGIVVWHYTAISALLLVAGVFGTGFVLLIDWLNTFRVHLFPFRITRQQ